MGTRTKAITGCLLGTALGDALGLPAEGLTRRRQQRLFGAIDTHRFLFGRGMVSDDTEHTIMVAQALIASAGSPTVFEHELARRLRGWILCFPAGVGLATLRACARLLVGVPPAQSGVFSAGNGPAMRAALLGVCYGDDASRLTALVRASSHLTHTDPKAEYGALAVALAAHYAATHSPDTTQYIAALRLLLPADKSAAELLRLVERAGESILQGETSLQFADSLGLQERVSGYVYHTVPVALYGWLTHPNDYRNAVQGVIACGGDTDTTAAITGAIVGAGVGASALPCPLLERLAEWPATTNWLSLLAAQLAETVTLNKSQKPRSLFPPAVAARNLFFLCVVLCHGFRRLLPPF